MTLCWQRSVEVSAAITLGPGSAVITLGPGSADNLKYYYLKFNWWTINLMHTNLCKNWNFKIV